MTMPRPLTRALALLLLALAAAAPVRAADEPPPERLEVAAPYLEMHTGPGRGYPVFHVVERAQGIELLLRRTEWFLVRTADGKEGWVHRSQLATTLTATGDAKRFRDPGLDDFLQRRGDVGAALGRLRGEPMHKLWVSRRLAEVLSVEATFAEAQGTFSGSNFWHLGVNAEPWAAERWSPYFGVGVGKFRNIPNLSLVDALPVNARMALATAGLRYHLGQRFIARADYTLYTAFVADTRNVEVRAVTLGLSFFY